MCVLSREAALSKHVGVVMEVFMSSEGVCESVYLCVLQCGDLHLIIHCVDSCDLRPHALNSID